VTTGPAARTELSPFLTAAGGTTVLDARTADVGITRERLRRRRVAVTLLLLVLGGLLVMGGAGVDWTAVLANPITVPVLFIGLMAAFMVVYYASSGRSPHTLMRPEQIDVGLADVIGLEPVKEDIVRSLNLFLAHRTFAREMGGTPRRGLLFEGPPGTGKTHTAKAMAREAGVPFLFATATSFQSSYYGATARKIRSYFKELRRVARREGGAIGFIDEFDAIGGARRGLEMRAEEGGSRVANRTTSDLAGPVVNELLVQMQSIDTPVGGARLAAWARERVNGLLPAHRQLVGKPVERANILVVASTNRADGLDPALLRPGRFDRRLAFELPDKAGRRAMVDHLMARKAHAPELDDDERRDALAAVTTGYSPVMIEHLLDEALVNALRRGAVTMTWADLEKARLTEEVGLASPVAYTAHEGRLIATHEAGHATVAWLVAPERRLEVLTMLKRRSALGMLAHGDREDVFTRSSAELRALVQIAFGGMVAEELFFGDTSTGPAGDLAYATTVGAQMVGSAGMAGSLVSFEAIASGPLGGSNLVGHVLGDRDARARLETLLEGAKAHVTSLLTANLHLVEALRDALLTRHELVGTEITDVLEAARASYDGKPIPGLPIVLDLREGDPAVAR